MDAVKTINYVDSRGGLSNAFFEGFRPLEVDEGPLRAIVEDAFDAYAKYAQCVSTFYAYAENCSFEE